MSLCDSKCKNKLVIIEAFLDRLNSQDKLRLQDLGLNIGSILKVKYQLPFKGPVVFEHKHSILSLEQNLAQNITVQLADLH